MGNGMGAVIIGKINNGVDGWDEYLRVWGGKEDRTLEDVREFVMRSRYDEGRGTPGGYFCRECSVVLQQYRDNDFIVTVHHRYDV